MKLADLKVIYICPDHNEKYHARKLHMDNLLATIGFTDVHHYKSSTENYPACLIKATIDILQSNMDHPFLLLEDDVDWTGGHEFDLDPSADAIYFGLSKCGGSATNDGSAGGSKYTDHSETHVRIQNMLSAHAIFYISQRYKQAVVNTLTPYISISYYNDVLISRIQSQYMVLGQKQPFFYQSSKFNSSDIEERATKIQISPVLWSPHLRMLPKRVQRPAAVLRMSAF